MSVAQQAPERALEAHHYTDPAWFAHEQRTVFARTWQYAGHASQVRNAGDFFAFALHGRSLFCVRDAEGAVRTFYNVCAHRAHELVAGAGHKRKLVCPYHAWSYGFDGRLANAPGSREVPGFDATRICLTAVRTEVMGGFIFVNLDDSAAPMSQWYPGLAEGLAAFLPDLDVLEPVLTREVSERCNWKVSVENYSECYHCRLNHPTFSSGVVDPKAYNITPYGHTLRHTTHAVSADSMSYALDPDAHPHAMDYSSWFMWPGFSFQVYPGNVLNTYCWVAEDARTTRVVRHWYAPHGVASPALEGLANQDLETTVAEDIRLVESVQRGLESGGYRPGPLVINPAGGVISEHSISALNGWLREMTATAGS
ncbi:MAG: aromatic ring-hydroxylating dioxygenase subunit alpha [Pseudomonadota bacterium]